MVRYAHDMIFPELIKENASPVVDLQGRLIAGPDRRYDSPMMKWQMWKKAVEFADKIEPVHHKIKMYYEKYKHLSRPPKEGEEVIPPVQEGVSVSLTKPFKAPRFTWSYTSLQEFLTCPAQWAAKRYYKTIVEKESEAMRVGNLIHATAEHYLKAKIGEPHDVNQINPDYLPMVQPYCDAIRAAHAAGAEVYVEHEFCYTSNFTPCGWKDWNTVWVRGKGDVLIKNGNKLSIADWKGLDITTPLPTPSGWTTMGEVQVGDEILGADGMPCTVAGKSKVKNIDCFELTFCDGSVVVCDHEHLWEVQKRVGKNKYSSSIVSADDLHKTGVSKLSIRLAKPINTLAESLGLPFYTLGCWLGDGKHTDGSITKGDQGIFEHIESEGFVVLPPQRCADETKTPCRTVKGLRTVLRHNGLLGHKHIPSHWLRASYSDRVSLLQGLMDTDGTWNNIRKQAIFCTCDKALSKAVHELLCTLGQRPVIHVTKQTGFGLTVTAYNVAFTPVYGLVPFKTNIKREKMLANTGTQPRTNRLIKSIRRVDSVPTQCIAVNSPDNMYLCGESMIPTHNTGKYKEDFLQLKLFAVLAALQPQFKDIQEFDPKFIFTKEAAPKNILKLDKPIQRSELKSLLAEILVDVRRMEAAWESENFPSRRNFLCRSWCYNNTCPHCGG